MSHTTLKPNNMMYDQLTFSSANEIVVTPETPKEVIMEIAKIDGYDTTLTLETAYVDFETGTIVSAWIPEPYNEYSHTFNLHTQSHQAKIAELLAAGYRMVVG